MLLNLSVYVGRHIGSLKTTISPCRLTLMKDQVSVQVGHTKFQPGLLGRGNITCDTFRPEK